MKVSFWAVCPPPLVCLSLCQQHVVWLLQFCVVGLGGGSVSLPGSSLGSFWLFGSVESPRDCRDGFSASESRIVVLPMGRALERGWRRSRGCCSNRTSSGPRTRGGFPFVRVWSSAASPSVVTFIPTYFILCSIQVAKVGSCLILDFKGKTSRFSQSVMFAPGSLYAAVSFCSYFVEWFLSRRVCCILSGYAALTG